MNKAELAVFAIQKQMYEDEEFFSKSKVNPFYSSKYVPLPALLRILIPKLHEKDCKLSHTMKPTMHHNLVEVVCTVKHTDGSVCEGSAIMPLEVHEVSKKGEQVMKLNGQEAGKAFTYGRRYSTEPLFAIPAYDDDCEGAMKREKKEEKQEAPKAVDPYPHLAKHFKKPEKDIKARLEALGFNTPEKVISAGSEKIISILKESINE